MKATTKEKEQKESEDTVEAPVEHGAEKTPLPSMTIALPKLVKVITALAVLVDEAKMVFGADGITIKSVDPSHVAMGDIALAKGLFDSYECPEDMEAAINLDPLADFLRTFTERKLSGALKLWLDNPRKVKSGETIYDLHIEHPETHIHRKFDTVDTCGFSDPKVPNIDLNAELTLPFDGLELALAAAGPVSDHIEFIVTKERARLVSEGDTSTMTKTFPAEELPDGITIDGVTRCLFPLDYISKMVRTLDDSDSGTIGAKTRTDYPIEMTAQFFDGNLKVRFLLAPRIESERP